MSNPHTSEMSLADLKAHVERMEAEARGAQTEELRPVLEALLTRHTCKASEKSTFVGFTAEPVTITVDGTRYKVSVIVTDVAAKAVRDEAKKVALTAERDREALAKRKTALEAERAAVEARLAAADAAAGQNRG